MARPFADFARNATSVRRHSPSAGMNADFVGFIERGENVPTLTTILQVARALGVQPSAIIEDFDE